MQNTEQDKDLFKLVTRRWIALPLIFVALACAVFLVVFGAWTGQTELATMGAAAIFTEMGTVVAFYFARKLNEE